MIARSIPSIMSRILLLVLLAVGWAPAQHAGYYNHPDIHGDVVVFASEGDLWRVAVAGGVATRLTSDVGIETHPRISPDGETVAFAAEYDGNLDVYAIPIAGGSATRLTWHPGADVPSGWTPDGAEILHFTARSHPRFDRETWAVPAKGGVPRKFPIGTSSYATVSADGKMVAFNRNYVQTRTWKRYGGGLADDVWIGDLAAGTFTQVTKYFGNDLNPMFVGERLVFASERDGRMNLWSTDLKGADLRQETKLADFDVRFPETDGRDRVVFQHGADIYLYDMGRREARKIDIALSTDRSKTRPQLPPAAKFLDDFAISNDGRKLLVAARGDLFNVPVKSGRVVPLTASPNSRERVVAFAGEKDDKLAYFSDASGDYEVYAREARTGANEERITDPADATRGTFQPFFRIAASPDGSAVAFADQRGTLYWTNLTTKTLTLVDRGPVWEIRDYEWSPDSRWLAYARTERNEYSRVYIHDTKSGENRAVTDGMFDSFSPTWDPEGKHLYYLSNRTFNRQDAAFEYETVMVDPTRIYAILLDQESKNPFLKRDPYEEDDEKKAKEEKEKKEKKDKKKTSGDDDETTATLATKEKDEEKDKKVEVKIAFEGIANRHIEFPMASGEYRGLRAAKGRVFYLDSTGEETLLRVYDHTKEKPEPKTFAAKVSSYAISRNREHIAVLAEEKITVSKASADKPGDDDPSPDLSRIHIETRPVEEWRQIFRETVRYNRDFFHDPKMALNDWEATAATYSPLVERVSIRQELTDLIGNLIGELGHGHTYVSGNGDAPTGRTVSTGLLGVNFAVDETSNTVRLEHILRGERWNAKARSPFNNELNEGVADGSYLLTVNGKPVTADVDPLSHFWGLAGKDVLLGIAPVRDLAKTKEYRVTLLSSEDELRYFEWVKGRREYVAAKTDGQIGYVYIPNMGTDGLQAFFRDYFSQIDRKALVIDVRWNGGGNVSQMLIRRLSEKFYAMMKPRNFEFANTYPSRVFQGPMAALINDRCGSDGDIFSRSFRKFGLGPLIGERTWGGVVGIRFATRFVDGGGMNVPEFAFMDAELGYGIENYGIEPDPGYEVSNSPDDEVAGRDPQLDRAIEYLMAEMKKEKYQPMKFPDQIDRSPAHFRERSREWMDKP